jgi:hypothetical protein
MVERQEGAAHVGVPAGYILVDRPKLRVPAGPAAAAAAEPADAPGAMPLPAAPGAVAPGAVPVPAGPGAVPVPAAPGAPGAVPLPAAPAGVVPAVAHAADAVVPAAAAAAPKSKRGIGGRKCGICKASVNTKFMTADAERVDWKSLHPARGPNGSSRECLVKAHNAAPIVE